MLLSIFVLLNPERFLSRVDLLGPGACLSLQDRELLRPGSSQTVEFTSNPPGAVPMFNHSHRHAVLLRLFLVFK